MLNCRCRDGRSESRNALVVLQGNRIQNEGMRQMVRTSDTEGESMGESTATECMEIYKNLHGVLAVTLDG